MPRSSSAKLSEPSATKPLRDAIGVGGDRHAPPSSQPAAQETIEPVDETPLDYMLRVMRDPRQPEARRDAMAKAALPYLHSRDGGGGDANDSKPEPVTFTWRPPQA